MTTSNWIQEGSPTIGQGDVSLSGSIVGQTRFRDALSAGDVFYSIVDGANRECGVGVFNGTAVLTRANIEATLVNGIYADSSPSPISLSGTAVVSCTVNAREFNALISDIAQLTLDVAQNTSDIATNAFGIHVNSEDIIGNAFSITTNTDNISSNDTDITALQEALAVLEDDVSYREMSITALETGGLITQNGSTAILVTAGSGEIIDSYTDPENQATEEAVWVEQTFDLLASGGLPIVTGLGYTTIGVESVGGLATIKAYPNGVSSSQRRVVILLGHVEYVDRAITKVLYAPVISNQIGNVLMDVIDFSDSNVKGMLVRPTAIGDLSIWRDAGELFIVGINYINDKANQNVGQIAAVGAPDTPTSFNLLTYNNGSTGLGASVTLVPEDAYEPDGAGVIDTLSNTHTTIHYIIESKSGSRFMSYGQQEYATHAEAVSNLFADNAAHLFPAETLGMFVLAQIVIDKSATVWGLAAEIFPLGSAVASGSTGGAASQAINISYSDTYNIGSNVQAALDSLAALKLTPDQLAAINAANTPSGANAFATILDIDSANSGLADHLADTVDAHDASAISVVPTGSISSTDVQAAIAELDSGVEINSVDITDHVYDTLRAHNGTAVEYITTGNSIITADNVSEALDQLEAVVASGGGGAVPGTNLLINGNFDIIQRGTSFSGDGYDADRFLAFTDGFTFSHSLSDFADGQIDVPNGSTRFMSLHASNVGGTFTWGQRMEDVRKTGGRTVTLSFWGRAATVISLECGASQNFGGGSGSPDVYTLFGSVDFNTVWRRFELTATLPSVAGKDINKDTYLDVHVVKGSLVGYFDIADVQLEFGASASAFEFVHIADQLVRCRRYFESINALQADKRSISIGQVVDTNKVHAILEYSTKRAVPVVTIEDISKCFLSKADGGRTSIGSYANTYLMKSNVMITYTAGTHDLIPGHACQVDNDSTIITIDAEL